MRSLVLLLVFLTALSAQEKYAISSGDWFDAAMWSPAGVPTPDDDVIIDANMSCNLRHPSARAKSVLVYGLLIIEENGDILDPNVITVSGEGHLWFLGKQEWTRGVRLQGGHISLTGTSPVNLVGISVEGASSISNQGIDAVYSSIDGSHLARLSLSSTNGRASILGITGELELHIGSGTRVVVDHIYDNENIGKIVMTSNGELTLTSSTGKSLSCPQTEVLFDNAGHNSATIHIDTDVDVGPINFIASSGQFEGYPGPTIRISEHASLRSTVTEPAIYQGSIEGAGSLKKSGPGDWRIRGTLAHTGPTTVEAGSMSIVQGEGQISASSGIHINPFATLALSQGFTGATINQLADSIPIDLRGTLEATSLAQDNIIERIGAVTASGNATISIAGRGYSRLALTLSGLNISGTLSVNRMMETDSISSCFVDGMEQGPVANINVNGLDAMYRLDTGLIPVLRQSVADGHWSDGYTWLGRVGPAAGDDVTIAHHLRMGSSSGSNDYDLGTLTFRGSSGAISVNDGYHPTVSIATITAELHDSGLLAVPIRGSLPVKQGNGNVTIAGPCESQGIWRIAAGSLTLAAGSRTDGVIFQIDAGTRLIATTDLSCAGITGSGDIDLGSYSLTLTTASSSDIAFTGSLTAGSLIKAGAGRQRLGGVGTVPNTAINAGSLALTGVGSLSGDVEVAAAARCEGSGAITGTLRVRSGATIAPGLNTTSTHPVSGDVGELVCSQLVLDDGAHLDADLGSLSDHLRVIHQLTLASTSTINVKAGAGYGSGIWSIVDLDLGGTVVGTTAPQRGAAPGSNVMIALLNGQVLWQVDATPPLLSRITSTTTDGTWHAGDSIVIALEYSEPVTLIGSLTATLDLEPTPRTVTIAPGHGATLTGTYVVQAGDWSAGGLASARAFARLNVTALSLSGTLADDAGNAVAAPGALPAPDARLAATKALYIDNAAPTVPTNLPLSVTAGQSALLATRLVADDLETPLAELAYSLDLSPSQGVIEHLVGDTWQPLAVGAGWTQGDIDASAIRYRHTGALVAGNDGFAVTLRDTHATPERRKSSVLTAVNVSISGLSAPVFDDPNQTILLVPGLTITGTIHAIDPQGTAVTYQQIDASSTTNGIFTISADGAWSYEHRTWSGITDQVSVRARDANGETADLTIPVLVSSADDAAPRFQTPAPLRAQVGAQFSYVPVVRPGDHLIYTLVERPAGFDDHGGLFGGPTNGTITWPVLPASADGYHRFGILAVDRQTRKAGFQRIFLRVTTTPPAGGG